MRKALVLLMVVGCTATKLRTSMSARPTTQPAQTFTCREFKESTRSTGFSRPRIFPCAEGHYCDGTVLHVTPDTELIFAVEGQWSEVVIALHDSVGHTIRLGGAIFKKEGEQKIAPGLKVTVFSFDYPSFLALEQGGPIDAFILIYRHGEKDARGFPAITGEGCADVVLLLTPTKPIPLRHTPDTSEGETTI